MSAAQKSYFNLVTGISGSPCDCCENFEICKKGLACEDYKAFYYCHPDIK